MGIVFSHCAVIFPGLCEDRNVPERHVAESSRLQGQGRLCSTCLVGVRIYVHLQVVLDVGTGTGEVM